MDTNLSYQEAINIIAFDSYDAKKIAIRLAQVNPELFIQLHAESSGSPIGYQKGHLEVIQYLKSGDAVGAIKSLRTMYDLGLKEAKDIIDNLRDIMMSRGILDDRVERPRAAFLTDPKFIYILKTLERGV